MTVTKIETAGVSFGDHTRQVKDTKSFSVILAPAINKDVPEIKRDVYKSLPAFYRAAVDTLQEMGKMYVSDD